MPDSIISWLRDLLRSPRLISFIGSIVGLVTIASWLAGDPTPFTSLAAAAKWFGIHIGHPLSQSDAWLNRSPRHEPLVIVSSLLLFVAALQQAALRANQHEQYEACFGLYDDRARAYKAVWNYRAWLLEREYRFWSLALIVTGLTAQLHEASAFAVIGGLAVILLLFTIGELKDETGMQRVIPRVRPDTRNESPLSQSAAGWHEIPRRRHFGNFITALGVTMIRTVNLVPSALVFAPMLVWFRLTEPNQARQRPADSK